MKLFIYGTLQLPEVQQKIIGRKVDTAPDSLHGYHRGTVSIHGRVYPIAEPAAGEKIKGSIIKVSEVELHKIDEYETKTYKRIGVNLESGTKAWVYIQNSRP